MHEFKIHCYLKSAKKAGHRLNKDFGPGVFTTFHVKFDNIEGEEPTEKELADMRLRIHEAAMEVINNDVGYEFEPIRSSNDWWEDENGDTNTRKDEE